MNIVIKGSVGSMIAAGSLFCSALLSSCASPAGLSLHVDRLIVQGDYARAKSFLEKNEKNYGTNNTLLYFLDRGFLCHLSKEYAESIQAFDQAKKEYDRLYTRSVTGILGSWLLNDYTMAYAGEDFERVLINIFQALNYSMLGKSQDALVEARDVDLTLNLINRRYKQSQENVYREDAFARLLMGLLYESSFNSEGYNNAYVSYVKAAEIYETDYKRYYQVPAPEILKEGLLSTASFMGPDELAEARARYGDVAFVALEEKKKKAEIFLIQYNGYSPIKTEIAVPIPLPDGNVTTLVLPKYDRRYNTIRYSALMAKNDQNSILKTESQVVEDINAIAIKNAENKRARIIAKGIAVSAGKYAVEKIIEQRVEEKWGETAQMNAILLSSLFNVYTNRVDLRSWQTLPSEIRLARLLLDPGVYQFSVQTFDFQRKSLGEVILGSVQLRAGERKIFIIRTAL